MLSAHPSDAILQRLRRAPLVVGFSGGLDSTVLLHWLAATTGLCPVGLRALHVHHGLHPDAERWAAHCEAACRRLGVPLRVVRVSVPRDGGEGPEAAARHARHAAFEAELAEGEVLALAHHRDDQAETFLLRALRGSGVDGLGAMRAWRRCGRGWLWRPLLATPRTELLAYARTYGLDWLEDPANADTAFDRNFLRHRVLPLLRERWPHADAGFARSAALSAEAAALLEDEDAAALAAATADAPDTLSVAALGALPQARRARVLRRWIASLALPPLPARGIERIEEDLLQARPDAAASFAWNGARIRRWRALLHAERPRPPLPRDWDAAWDGCAPLLLPDGGLLRLLPEGAGFGCTLRARARRGGERIVLPGRRHSHSLKHVLQERGVPPWLREHLPLLCADDGTVLAAGDLVLSAALVERLRGAGARLAWRPRPD